MHYSISPVNSNGNSIDIVYEVDDSDKSNITPVKPAESAQAELSTQTLQHSIQLLLHMDFV